MVKAKPITESIFFCKRIKQRRRAIERDINPKALQKLLGHATLQTTTDTYVHVTDDAKVDAVNLFESNEPAIFKIAKKMA